MSKSNRIMVVNIKHYGKPRHPWDVYIGRGSYGMEESPLYNPFRGDNETAVGKFRSYFTAAVNEDSMDPSAVSIRAEIKRLLDLWQEHGRLVLVCWCKPKPCHGDVIKSHLEHRIDEGNDE